MLQNALVKRHARCARARRRWASARASQPGLVGPVARRALLVGDQQQEVGRLRASRRATGSEVARAWPSASSARTANVVAALATSIRVSKPRRPPVATGASDAASSPASTLPARDLGGAVPARVDRDARRRRRGPRPRPARLRRRAFHGLAVDAVGAVVLGQAGVEEQPAARRELAEERLRAPADEARRRRAGSGRCPRSGPRCRPGGGRRSTTVARAGGARASGPARARRARTAAGRPRRRRG